MTTPSKELATVTQTAPALTAFGAGEAFELAQRQAKALSESSLVPEAYRKNVPNCLIALEIAHRTGASVLAVTQNLNVIHGKPSWSSQFIIAALNSCGRFTPLKFNVTVLGNNDKSCYAYATDKDGEIIEGPPVSISMAKAEGWFDKSGSKWKTMPDLMLRYRAAAFFGRLYAPDVLMGMQSEEEVHDVVNLTPATGSTPAAAASSINDRIRKAKTPPSAEEGSAIEVVVEQVATPEEVKKEFF